jgi:hypothetical protein
MTGFLAGFLAGRDGASSFRFAGNGDCRNAVILRQPSVV